MIIKNSYTPGKGFYAKCVPKQESIEALKYILSNNPLELNELSEDPHVTLVYSKDPIKFVPKDLDFKVKAKCLEIKYWPGHDKSGYLVVTLESKGLCLLHRVFKALGASHSFDYQPHLTVAKDFGKLPEIDQWLSKVNGFFRNTAMYLEFSHVECSDLKE